MENNKNNSKKTILITGGAGYVGSVTAVTAIQTGYHVVIIDRLDHQQNTPDLAVDFFKGDCGDKNFLTTIFSQYNIHAVIHCAGYIEVGKSVTDPAQFYHNNVSVTLILLDIMRQFNVSIIIFSSSCAVYGDPINIPIHESHTKNPINPYGKTKLTVEHLLHDYNVAYDINFVILRYFNVAGALPELNLGESHVPETHVIPLLLCSLQIGAPFFVFGRNYPTTDGTCVRDYIHVLDIAAAHLKALLYLEAGEASTSFNLGTGNGYSVQQLITTAQEICQREICCSYLPARTGDVAILIADHKKAEHQLGWHAQYSDLKTLIQSAWAWEQKRALLLSPTLMF